MHCILKYPLVKLNLPPFLEGKCLIGRLLDLVLQINVVD